MGQDAVNPVFAIYAFNNIIAVRFDEFGFVAIFLTEFSKFNFECQQNNGHLKKSSIARLENPLTVCLDDCFVDDKGNKSNML